MRDGDLWFASEAKALFAGGEVEAAPDLAGLDEVFTFWAARAPRTVFRGVSQLEPGTFAVWQDGALRVSRYYQLEYPEEGAEPRDVIAQLDALMRSGVDLQMRSDVPVGGYLSGGLDSSITCALAAGGSPFALRTFSVAFDDPRFDESAFQRLVASELKSVHAVQTISQSEIGEVFPDVIWHAETPIVRTAPAPMFLLSRLTAAQGVKVVLTGRARMNCSSGTTCSRKPWSVSSASGTPARHRARGCSIGSTRISSRRDTAGARCGAGSSWRRVPSAIRSFPTCPGSGSPAGSRTRTARPLGRRWLGCDVMSELRDALPPGFSSWSALNRAAYLEMTTLLSGYLFSSQGERMGMAHSVEGRFPFLDHRLFEFAAALPTRSKLRGLREKDVLRRWAAPILPESVGNRPKQPYRAPDAPAFFHPGQPGYVDELLGEAEVSRVGLFDARAVAGLVRRCRAGRVTGFRENQALVAILSTQLWHSQFIGRRRHAAALPLGGADVVLRESPFGIEAGVNSGSGQ